MFILNNMMKFKLNGEELIARRYKKGDEKELLPMMTRILDKNLTLDYWNWKYNENPNGNLLIVGLNKNNQIIGCWGNIIRRGYYYGKEISFFNNVDTFTREDYR